MRRNENGAPPKRSAMKNRQEILSSAIVTAQALLVAQGRLRDEVRRLTAVEELYQTLGDTRMPVEVVQAAGKVAQVGKSAVQTALRTQYAHIVPHDMPDGRPVLCDEGGIIVLVVAGMRPVGDLFIDACIEPLGT